MDVHHLQAFCLELPGAWADNPWDHEFPVIKIGPGGRGKIFAFLATDGVGIKAAKSREAADEWLERYPGSATVMRYIGRSGWNSLAFDGVIPDDEIIDAVLESYQLVASGLPVKHRPDGWNELD